MRWRIYWLCVGMVIAGVVGAQLAREADVPQLPEGYAFAGGDNALTVVNNLCADLCVAGATREARLVVATINNRYLAGNVEDASRQLAEKQLRVERLGRARDAETAIGSEGAGR